jgi:integrase
MRKGEMQNLTWDDIFYERSLIRLKHTKNGDPRHVYLNEAAKKAILSIPKHPESSFVFCGDAGKLFNFRKSFETALKKSGITDFHFHDLRHTYASHLVMAGVDLNTVRELLGHKSLAMTLRYSHLSQEHKARAVEMLDKRLRTGTPVAQTPKSENQHKFYEVVSTLV